MSHFDGLAEFRREASEKDSRFSRRDSNQGTAKKDLALNLTNINPQFKAECRNPSRFFLPKFHFDGIKTKKKAKKKIN